MQINLNLMIGYGKQMNDMLDSKLKRKQFVRIMNDLKHPIRNLYRIPKNGSYLLLGQTKIIYEKFYRTSKPLCRLVKPKCH